MGIGNDGIGKKIDPNMPGQQVHVHVPAHNYVYSTHEETKGNVLKEIGCMGEVVGSGHAY